MKVECNEINSKIIYEHAHCYADSEENLYCYITYCSQVYRKSGNFYAKIIHALNIHFDLFSWVYGTHENILM